MMMTIVRDGHTAACVAAQERAFQDRAAFYRAHPDACRSCDGIGTLVGSMEFDTGYVPVDPCEDCTERGRCSACGAGLPPGGDGTGPRACGCPEEGIEAPPPFEGCCCWLGTVDDSEASARRAYADEAARLAETPGISASDFEHADAMAAEAEAADADGYPYDDDDLAFDAARERGAGRRTYRD
jgi:hypothetical protein